MTEEVMRTELTDEEYRKKADDFWKSVEEKIEKEAKAIRNKNLKKMFIAGAAVIGTTAVVVGIANKLG